MKKIIILLLAVALFSCKKEKPECLTCKWIKIPADHRDTTHVIFNP